MNAKQLTRQADLIPSTVLGEKITIIGAGAIGGMTALGLAKTGFSDITVMDFDTIEDENMNSQFYRIKDIGKPKVEALAELVEDFTGVKLIPINKKFEGGSFPGIVISAVDSMAVRKLIWEHHVARGWFTRVVIDPRMGAEQALLYAMRPRDLKDRESYAKTLYTDEEAVHERCTAKATMYTALMLSGLVVKAVKDELTSPRPLRTAQWNIGENEALFFHRAAKTEVRVHTSQGEQVISV